MTEASKTFEQMTLLDTDNAISSPASEPGPTRSGKPDGRMIDQPGQDRARASRSVPSARKTLVCSELLYEGKRIKPQDLPKHEIERLTTIVREWDEDKQ